MAAGPYYILPKTAFEQFLKCSESSDIQKQGVHNAFFQIKIFSRFHYVLLCNL